ncbi:MAG: mechanosensitive ion channel family protein [Thermoplasmata archaeon]|nr:mechanosensitive ion channel family protein [Thermoplasmata archaeon]
MTETPPEVPRAQRWAVVYATGLLILLGAAGTLLYSLVTQYSLLPTGDLSYLRVALILALGVIGVIVVGRIVFSLVGRFAGNRHAGLITDVYRIVGFAVLAVIALYAIGVNGYALLAGGTFAGLVIGLASQTALSNFVAGVVLLVSRPFEPGDRLTLTTSQFNVILPVYPPKFYSQDLLVPGFTGTVQDIGLMYTVLRLDEGPIASFPNSIVILGAVISHNVSERWVRVKYEVPQSLDPSLVLDRVRAAVVADPWVVGKRSVRVLVNQATQASYVISIDALCSGNHEEAPRSALYLRIMHTIGSLGPAGAAGVGPEAPNPPPQPSALPVTPAPASADARL